MKAFEEKVKALSEAKAKALTALDAEMKSLRATQEEIMHKFDEAVQALQPVGGLQSKFACGLSGGGMRACLRHGRLGLHESAETEQVQSEGFRAADAHAAAGEWRALERKLLFRTPVQATLQWPVVCATHSRKAIQAQTSSFLHTRRIAELEVANTKWHWCAFMSLHCAVRVHAGVQMRTAAQLQIAQCEMAVLRLAASIAVLDEHSDAAEGQLAAATAGAAAAAGAQEAHVQAVQQELQRLQEQLAAVQQVSQKEQS